MDELIRMHQQAEAGKFYGSITAKYEAGKVKQILRQESIIPAASRNEHTPNDRNTRGYNGPTKR